MQTRSLCGTIQRNSIGQTISVTGWVDRYRDHGGILLWIVETIQASSNWCFIQKKQNY